jgi:hypothetical protein
MNDDKISTFTCALAGLGVIGLATIGCWAWCRKDETSIGALVGGSDVALLYWRDGLPVRVGDRFRRDPLYDDLGIYKVVEVSPDEVRFHGESYPYGTIRVWGSDFFQRERDRVRRTET